MWQVAVAAAVPGSGLIAKHLFSPNSHSNNTSNTTQTEPNLEVDQEESQILNDYSKTHFISSHSPIKPPVQKSSNCSSVLNHNESLNATKSTIHEEEDEVFWFSSSGSGNRSRSRSNSRKSGNLSKKTRRTDKSASSFNNGSVYQRKSCGKRVKVCLERRKTTENSREKHNASLSKDCSSFDWRLGLGIIYMMSAGKAEISKLRSTIDETAKVVRELQSELNKQKLVPCHQILNYDGAINTVDTMQKPVAEQVHMESCSLSKQPIDTKFISHLADSDYASSVLTEEQQHEGTEMNQLEAELESELQKLPWCTTEASDNVEHATNLTQMERHEALNPLLKSYQSDGVHPAELKSKLSSLLIQQQENHISELESELNLAYSKLQDKEAELQALKDC